MKFHLYYTAYTKNYLKWVIDLNVKHTIVKLLEENIGKNPHNLGLHRVLRYDTKSMVHQKHDELEYIKI